MESMTSPERFTLARAATGCGDHCKQSCSPKDEDNAGDGVQSGPPDEEQKPKEEQVAAMFCATADSVTNAMTGEGDSNGSQQSLADLAREGGGIHSLRLFITNHASPASSDGIAKTSNAEQRKERKEAAKLALDHEARSNMNKLAPDQRALALTRLAGLDNEGNSEMALRDMGDVLATSRRTRKRKTPP
jgi:hypothetical protein